MHINVYKYFILSIFLVSVISCQASLNDYLDSYSFDKTNNEFEKNTEQKQYLIISDKSIIPLTEDFQNHKRDLGFNVSAIPLNVIYSNVDREIEKIEKLRNFIIEEKNTENTEYVLLIGSPKIIPMLKLKSHNFFNEEITIPTDKVYEDLESNWGLNGEDPDIKYNHNVFLGRIPFDKSSVISKILSNTIEYETMKGTDLFFRKQARLLGGSFTRAYLRIDTSRFPIDSNGFLLNPLNNMVFFKADVPTFSMYEEGLQGADVVLNKDSLVEQWNANDFGFVYTLAHGSPSTASIYQPRREPFLHPDIIKKITNPFPVVLFSASCSNGAPNGNSFNGTLTDALLKNNVIVYLAATQEVSPIEQQDLRHPIATIRDIPGITAQMVLVGSYILRGNSVGESLAAALNYYIDNVYYPLSPVAHTNLLAPQIYGDPSVRF